MNHPGDGALNEYVDRRLDRAAAAGVEAHLEECARCRERVTAIRSLNARLAGLPRGIAPRRDLREGIRRRMEITSPEATRTRRDTGSPSRGWLRAAVVALALAGGATLLWRGIYGGAPADGAPNAVIDSYANAAAELERAVEGRKADLGPAGSRALTESLASLDAAIRELERAGRGGRGGADAELLRQLEAQHRARLELLRGVKTLLEES